MELKNSRGRIKKDGMPQWSNQANTDSLSEKSSIPRLARSRRCLAPHTVRMPNCVCEPGSPRLAEQQLSPASRGVFFFCPKFAKCVTRITICSLSARLL